MLDRIHTIKNGCSFDLADEHTLEHDILPQLGLYKRKDQFPTALHEYTQDKDGLRSWQWPIQFAKYLPFLINYRIESYLEIGTKTGGTFIITIEYLKRFNDFKYADGIDIDEFDLIKEYTKENPYCKFHKMDTQTQAFKDFIACKTYDLAFIDGSHVYGSVTSDFYNIKDKAKIIVFHDIVSDKTKGVVQAYNEIKEKYKDTYTFHEFTDQYEDDSIRFKLMGIGVMVPKDLRPHCND